MTTAQRLGLFPERLAQSPYEIVPEDQGEHRPADSVFWDQVTTLVATGRAGLLEERSVGNVSRWHRLADGEIDQIRERLTPRAIVAVWPGISTDRQTALASLPDDHLVQLVWEDQDGRIRSRITDDARSVKLPTARGVMALSCIAEEQPPLLAAVLPDKDGVLRARWGSERDQEHLRAGHP